MLDATAGVVGEAAAESWRYYLAVPVVQRTCGCGNPWKSIGTDRTSFVLTCEGPFPMLRIPAELQKNNNDTLWPIAPEWGDMLMAVPAAERHGPVFPHPGGHRVAGLRLSHRLHDRQGGRRGRQPSNQVEAKQGHRQTRARGSRQICLLPRLAAVVRFPLGGSYRHVQTARADAAFKHRDNPAILRWAECSKHGGQPVGGPRQGNSRRTARGAQHF